MAKILLIICDGLSDRPVSELGGKTPLEAAFKPNLDMLALSGITGTMHTVDIGIRPGSDTAHLSIFGYDIPKYYTGRGPFEAAGLGMDIKKGDIAFRGNFATVNENLMVVDRRAGRIEKTQNLIKSLEKIKIPDVKIFIRKGLGHRFALTLRGKNLDGRISDTDPHETHKKVLLSKPLIENIKTKKTAKVVNNFTRQSFMILKNEPVANCILLRGAGTLRYIPSFTEKYNLKAACIAGGGLYKGIAKILGMDIIEVKGATGKPDTDVKTKINTALQLFEKYDFVFVHIKACDSLAEDGNFITKKAFIEKIDQALKPLTKRHDILTVVTADHTTSSKLKKHTADPVPVLITGEDIHTDHVTKFEERAVLTGGLGHIRGLNLMPIIIDLIGKAPLYGA